MGETGFGVDNLISMRVVLASGDIVTVSKSSNPDLFWAMRGAGPNFGIVISATIKSQPATAEDRTAYINNLFYTPDRIADVAQAMQDLPLTPEQRIYLVLTSSGPPLNEPSILITGLLRKGTEEEGRKAFAPFYDLGPVSNSSAQTQYLDWNDSNDGFCAREGRKPAYSTTINNMQSQKWPEIWDLYKAFQAKGPNSAVLIERYNLTKARAAPSGSAAMNEKLRTEAFAQAIVIPWYTDASMDAEATTFAEKVRALWSYNADPKDNPSYANFAHGDETPEAIYGSSLPKLKQIKKKYDPNGVFNQWFTIKP
jgi:FAD/FMN-containing dehydrogenase